MFLFRPSKNNQRYAIVPLLDRMDNDDEDFIDDRTGKWKGEEILRGNINKKPHVFIITKGKIFFQSFDLFSS